MQRQSMGFIPILRINVNIILETLLKFDTNVKIDVQCERTFKCERTFNCITNLNFNIVLLRD